MALPPVTPAAAPASDSLPEVLVTARRIEEAADRIPLAVDVVSAQQLGAGGVTGLQSLPQAAPGLSYEAGWGGSFAAPVLRGQAQPSAEGDNVGVFVDGLYQAGRSAIDVMALDLARIEIARGPQNTLLGRSTFSGAILYVPNAPTAERSGRLQADMGSDGLAGIEGAWSQRLASSSWLIRAAAGHRETTGTLQSLSGESLDDRRQDGIALTLAREAADGSRPIQLGLRYQWGRFGHPAVSTLDGTDYNCGGLDSESRLWSYYCGTAPVAREYDPSPGLPDSRARSGQATLRFGQPLGSLILDALLGYYAAWTTAIRDFDGSTAGLPMGVCTIGVNCQSDSPPGPVTRLASPNVVSRLDQDTTEWSAELRLGSRAVDGLRWMLGTAAWGTRSDATPAFGVDRDDLLANERLTALRAATPGRAGPISPLNNALVPDSRELQIVQQRSLTHRDGISVFGMLDLPLGPASRVRAELRAEHERQRLDSRIVNFRPDMGEDPAPIAFTVLTPRVSIDRRFSETWYGYASLARGARSGGINTLPDLLPEEQAYDPEHNWTAELGVRYAGSGAVMAWRSTLYYIDWRDTQIAGVSATPLVSSIITRNTAGIRTPGIETQLDLRAGPLLLAHLGYSGTDPRFVTGSDDAGSRVFCGLTAQPAASNLCDYGPPRTPNNGFIPLVPYIDDRFPGRTPRHSATASLHLLPVAIGPAWTLAASLSFAWQQDVFERSINGVHYGERGLLGASIVLRHRAWQFTGWGTNLTDDRYIRAAASRGGQFYPFLPRPLDFLHGEGRRVGLSVALDIAPP